MAYLVIQVLDNEAEDLQSELVERGLIEELQEAVIVCSTAKNFEPLVNVLRAGTGRTTQAIKEALSAVTYEGGDAQVAFICSDFVNAERIATMAREKVLLASTSIKRIGIGYRLTVSGYGAVTFIPSTVAPSSLYGKHFDWAIVDHYAYEVNPKGAGYIYNLVRR